MTESAAPPHLVVVGVDGSPTSIDALRWAVHQATHNHSHVEAIAVWEWPRSWGMSIPMPADFDPEADTRTMLEEAVTPLHTAHPEVVLTAVAVEGSPREVLIDASHRADLVVVGSHGHGELSSVVLGSVSLHVAAHAAAPVLVYRKHQPST